MSVRNTTISIPDVAKSDANSDWCAVIADWPSWCAPARSWISRSREVESTEKLMPGTSAIIGRAILIAVDFLQTPAGLTRIIYRLGYRLKYPISKQTLRRRIPAIVLTAIHAWNSAGDSFSFVYVRYDVIQLSSSRLVT